MASSPITSWQIDGETIETVKDYFLDSKSLQMVTAATKLKDVCSLGKKSYDQPRQCIKKQRHYFANKDQSGQNYSFSNSHVWMWELDCKESWASKSWCLWTVVLERTLESPLYCKEIQPVHPKGNQSWKFIGRADVEAETPIFWPPDAKNRLTRKDPDAGKVWRQEEKGTSEHEMVGWYQWLDGYEFEQAPGVGDTQGIWHAAVHGVAKSQTWLSDWTDWLLWSVSLLPHPLCKTTLYLAYCLIRVAVSYANV